MDLQNDQVIGIVGGMGPEAGITLLSYITEHTHADKDQDHLSAILMSFPKHISDRTLFLENNQTDNPGVSIAKVIGKLERAGATVVTMACNTSYCPPILNIIQEELSKRNSQVKLLHMPLETCKYLKKNNPELRRVGVLSTNGTYRSNLYKNLLQQMDFEVILPDFKFQNDLIHRMIYDPKVGIKANSLKITKEVRKMADQVLQYFNEKEAEAIILACTELSTVFKEKSMGDIVIIDATKIAALSLIKICTT